MKAKGSIVGGVFVRQIIGDDNRTMLAAAATDANHEKIAVFSADFRKIVIEIFFDVFDKLFRLFIFEDKFLDRLIKTGHVL